MLFGKPRITNNVIVKSQSEFSLDEMKEKLLKAAKQILNAFEVDMMERYTKPLSINMIDIYCTDNHAKGSVECIYCLHKVKVSSKTSVNGSHSWVLSNLKTHIKSCIKSSQKSNQQPIDEKDDPLAHSEQSLYENFSPHENQKQNDEVKSETLLNEGVDFDEDSLSYENQNEKHEFTDATLLSLEIEPSFCKKSELQTEYEKILFAQLKVQLVKSGNATAKHREKKTSCFVNVSDLQTEKLHVCQVRPYGDCALCAEK